MSKFTDKLLKKSLIHDVELYPNFFSDVFKVPGKNKLLITIIYNEAEEVSNYYEEIKNRLSDYEVTFMNAKQLANWLKRYKPILIGYNSFHFDDPLVRCLVGELTNPRLTSILYDLGNYSITREGDRKWYQKYKYDKSLKGIDLMRVSGLDRLFKPLKQAAANLRHDKIQDLPIKPGSMIKPDEIVDLVVYEVNDVVITEKLLLGIPESHDSPTIPPTAQDGLLPAIQFRYEMGELFKVDILNNNKSQIGEKLAGALYSKASGRSYNSFKDTQTQRDIIPYKDVIFPVIKFKTKQLQEFLIKLKDLKYRPDNDSSKDFTFEFKFYNSNVVFAQGGIHGTHCNRKVFSKKENIELIDLDVGSFYPSLYWKYNIEPNHLPHFNDFVGDIISTRLRYKAEGNKLYANGLKLGINRIFGGFSDKLGWLYDVKALLQTTINGQLMILMLAEELELVGIPVFYYNTDGITVECLENKIPLLNNIWHNWESKLNMSLERDDFEICNIRDVNNFCSIKPGGKVKIKGAYEYTGYLEKYGEFDLGGSFNKPIVPYAVVMYFTKQIPISNTVRNHIENYPKDGIYDFCMAKKANKQFQNQLFTITPNGSTVENIQQSIRYFVSKSNKKLFKVKEKTDTELLGLVKNSNSKKATTIHHYVLCKKESKKGELIKFIEGKGFIYKLKSGLLFSETLKKEHLHYDELESGRNITLFNDYFESSDYNIDYSYYLEECQKLIDAIEKNEELKEKYIQQTLF